MGSPIGCPRGLVRCVIGSSHGRLAGTSMPRSREAARGTANRREPNLERCTTASVAAQHRRALVEYAITTRARSATVSRRTRRDDVGCASRKTEATDRPICRSAVCIARSEPAQWSGHRETRRVHSSGQRMPPRDRSERSLRRVDGTFLAPAKAEQRIDRRRNGIRTRCCVGTHAPTRFGPFRRRSSRAAPSARRLALASNAAASEIRSLRARAEFSRRTDCKFVGHCASGVTVA